MALNFSMNEPFRLAKVLADWWPAMRIDSIQKQWFFHHDSENFLEWHILCHTSFVHLTCHHLHFVTFPLALDWNGPAIVSTDQSKKCAVSVSVHFKLSKTKIVWFMCGWKQRTRMCFRLLLFRCWRRQMRSATRLIGVRFVCWLSSCGVLWYGMPLWSSKKNFKMEI